MAEEEQIIDLDSLEINQRDVFPLKINAQGEILAYLYSGVLKPIENCKIRERFLKMMSQKRIGKLLTQCFWVVFFTKFPGCLSLEDGANEQYVEELKQKLSKTYVKIFSDIEEPKDELVNYLVYSIRYFAPLLSDQSLPFPLQNHLR